MDEQEKRTEEQEDVEAHRRHPNPQASEDTPEGESEDFELHRRHPNPQADDTQKDEGDSDDFELHRKGHRAL